ncbi:MAG TPA: lysine biosynthesis protein LysX [Phycisphaerales bacterium]|nr:lysine biosynthesis protein LysX [Phycisphaerales bacterium]
MRIALLYTRVRTEERMLADAFAARCVEVEMIDAREARFDLADAGRWREYDVVIDRCVSLTSALTNVRVLEHFGVRCVNSAGAIEVCSDKLRTTLALLRAGLPTPRTLVATAPEGALPAIEEIGYPAVLKPTVGSWGRLVSRVNDRDAAEAIVEHRDTLGSVQQHVYYVQEHVEKPGRDIRVFVVGGCAAAGITRSSAHWVTNTARGAVAEGLAIPDDLRRLCERSAAAVGADICAIDVLECPRRGYLINEINHSMEFRNSVATSGVDIPGLMVEHVVSIARSGAANATRHAGAVA